MRKRAFMALILACVLAFVQVHFVAVFAADGTGATGHYDKVETVVSALGINNDITGGADDILTRSEFTAMTIRLLNIGSYTYVDYYTDVDEKDLFASEISVATRLGIVNGVSDATFAPDKEVTCHQAIKMLVSALGLERPALVGGGYPYGYLRVADNLDITAGVSCASDAPLCYGDAMLLIYNTLLSYYVDVHKITVEDPDSIMHFRQTDTTVVNRFFNLDVKEGVVWSAGKASMHMKAGEDGFIEVDGQKYLYEGSDITDYLGLDVTMLVNDHDKVVAVVASEKNTIHTIKAQDIEDITSSYIKCYVGDKEIKYNFAADFTMVRNWRASSASQFNLEDAKVTVIDNDGDKRYDVVHVQKAETMIVANVSDNNVSDKYSGVTITLPDEVYVINGDDQMCISPDELVANMILAVYLDDSGNVSHVTAGYDILHGATVTGKDNEYIYIDDEAYELSAYFIKHFNYNVELGTRITVYFDSMGKVCYMEKYVTKNSGGMKYGYLIGTKFGGSFGEVLFNILTSEGNQKSFALKDKIVLDGETVQKNSDKIKNTFTRDGSKVKYCLIKYSVDSAGYITKIDTAEERTSTDFAEKYAGTGWESDNSLTLFVKGAKAMYRGTGNFFPYCVYGNPIVFEVPTALATQPDEDYDDALFSVRTKNFVDNDKCTLDLYDYDSAFSPAVIVNYAAAGSGIRPMDVHMDNDPIAVVADVGMVLNAEGDETIGLKLIKKGTVVSVKLASKILPYFEEKNLIPEKGDIIQYAVDGLGDIAGITLIDYNPKTGIFNIDYSKTGDGIIDNTTFIAGKVYSVSATHIAFAASTKPAAFSGVDHPDKYFIFKVRDGMTVTSCNLEEDEFRLGSLADIATIESVGEANASDVIMELDWGTPSSVVVYN